MSRVCEKLISPSIIGLWVVLIFLSASAAHAQSIHDNRLFSERERQQRRMDQLYRPPDTEFRRGKYITGERERHLAAASHVKRNAERLQFLKSRMAAAVSPDATPDYKAIEKTAGEIRKRASQLRYYLGLPKPQDAATLNQGGDRMAREELLAAVERLDAAIKNLGENPLLDRRGVVDATQAASAGRNLEEIIQLSDRIRKSAKRLGRKSG